METWFIILFSLSLCLFLSFIFSIRKPSHNLPPGPFSIPIITSLQWLVKSFSEIEPILRSLRAKYGPIITLRIGSRPAIFVTTHSLAHQALVQNGAVFADRPPALAVSKIISSNQYNISSAPYGPRWRLLRRNLTSEILHPSRVKSYSQARKWVLEILINRLKNHSESGEWFHVKEHFHYIMFCLLVLMCFGDKLDEEKIKEVQKVQRMMLLSFGRFNILNFLPSITRILFRRRWEELYKLQQDKENVLIPLIRARKNAKLENLSKIKEDNEEKQEFIVSYVDTLLDLQLPEGNRKLEEKEIVSLCSEFLDAGTDTTSTALQWIMANLIKFPHIQEKLLIEIKEVVSVEVEEIKEEDLQKMSYLKALVLEGLRRHPPGHFVLPHAVTQDTVLNGFRIPKDGTINFMVANMGLDPKVWKDPMEFNPERFLSNGGPEAFDITGSREIKMMPFGAGRRICPGFGLAMLHLEYFVANLVWNFKWMAVDGDDIDLSEKQEFTVVMKNPLKAHISPRIN
ncbi:cytochrome P450 89A2-like [Mercurialis annua]|uniref:cytochrome P450 89A2-like n=1 Tax=Mercurialis annua TaxID=3986 RepID=UPI00215FC39B|nr:cytochrome P450 89A2-like [Mercurialis annua]